MEVVDAEKLISLIEAKPVLWDKTLDVYKDRIATKRAWRDVCVALKPDFENLGDTERNTFGKEAIRRWTNLRDCFAKLKRDAKSAEKTGLEAKKRKKYVYSDQLQFLNKIYDAQNTVDSVAKKEEKLKNPLQEDEPQSTAEDTPNTGTAVNKADNETSNQTRKRKLNQTDEVESKLVQSLEPVIPCTRKAFLHSLMPHLRHYTDGDFLNFQMGVLQVIKNINQRKRATPQPQTSSYQMPFYNSSSTYNPQSSPFVQRQQTFLPTQQQSQIRLIKSRSKYKNV